MNGPIALTEDLHAGTRNSGFLTHLVEKRLHFINQKAFDVMEEPPTEFHLIFNPRETNQKQEHWRHPSPYLPLVARVIPLAHGCSVGFTEVKNPPRARRNIGVKTAPGPEQAVRFSNVLPLENHLHGCLAVVITIPIIGMTGSDARRIQSRTLLGAFPRVSCLTNHETLDLLVAPVARNGRFRLVGRPDYRR